MPSVTYFLHSSESKVSPAGGAAFETVLNFRVAHLSRRMTGGAFDLVCRLEFRVSITDAKSNQTAFTYDAFGRVTKTNFPPRPARITNTTRTTTSRAQPIARA